MIVVRQWVTAMVAQFNGVEPSGSPLSCGRGRRPRPLGGEHGRVGPSIGVLCEEMICGQFNWRLVAMVGVDRGLGDVKVVDALRLSPWLDHG